MRVLVNSRLHGLEINSKTDDAIVPFACMFNYSPTIYHTGWKFSKK